METDANTKRNDGMTKFYCPDCITWWLSEGEFTTPQPCLTCHGTNTIIDNRTPEQQDLDILRRPDLFDLLDAELGKYIEGEYESRRAILLATFIRLVANKGEGSANNFLVNSKSSTGKDFVCRAVCKLHPDQYVEAMGRASPTAFTYYKTDEEGFTWDGKILRLTDVSKQLMASDAFKVFLSDEEKSVIVNKSKQGRTQPEEYVVHGRPVLIATSAEANPSEEMLNRFNLITLDESTPQTRAITKRQLRQAAKKMNCKPAYNPVIRGALSRLKEENVVIPFAEDLAPYLPGELRARRDVPRIINLIRAAAASHQYQRQRDADGFIIAEERDYEIARQALKKIQTGSFVSLTRALRAVYDAAKEYYAANLKAFMAKELFAFKPVTGERTLYDHLNDLAEKGLLKITLEKREDSFKPVQVYVPIMTGLSEITLPPFKELGKTTIPAITTTASITTNASNATITSNTPSEGGAIEVNEAIEVSEHSVKVTQTRQTLGDYNEG